MTYPDPFVNKFSFFSMDESTLLTTQAKKKSLKEYDDELKALKEENFSLKIRIYMLEEEKVANEKNVPNEFENEKTPLQAPDLQEDDSDLTETDEPVSTSTQFPTKLKSNLECLRKSDNQSDSEQKDIELENLNSIVK